MRQTQLSSFDNSWYKPAPKLKIVVWYFVNTLFFINPLNPSSGIKVALLRLFGAKIGKNVLIKPGASIKYPWLLSIENNVWIGENVWIDNLARVSIASDVCISQGAMLLCGNHNYKKSSFDLIVGEINLEQGSWVGCRAVVCPGVTLKSHAILAVASVATQDLEAYKIYQGNPAVAVRDRNIES